MRKLPLAAALLVALAIATDAYAWGDEGHKVICQIAFDKVKGRLAPQPVARY
jgi:hypothetical protein